MRFPPEIQAILNRLREVIHEAAPEAIEKISYQMPTFWQNGNLVHFAAFKNHIGFYPTPDGITGFKDELSVYKNAKGSVQFPLDQPVPYDLVGRIVRFRVAENMKNAKNDRGKTVKNENKNTRL
ncbi:MAG: iron chaperone [Saccharofermentanales bacterium]